MRLYLLLIFFACLSLSGLAQQKTGTASYYHSKFSGRKTATGSIFNNQKMTAASNHYKLGEWVKVTNTENGKTVYVLINDRMAKNSDRLIDLTHKAANDLCFIQRGTCKVCVEKCSKPAEIEQGENYFSADSTVTID